jgi:hypothetical protein
VEVSDSEESIPENGSSPEARKNQKPFDRTITTIDKLLVDKHLVGKSLVEKDFVGYNFVAGYF